MCDLINKILSTKDSCILDDNHKENIQRIYNKCVSEHELYLRVKEFYKIESQKIGLNNSYDSVVSELNKRIEQNFESFFSSFDRYFVQNFHLQIDSLSFLTDRRNIFISEYTLYNINFIDLINKVCIKYGDLETESIKQTISRTHFNHDSYIRYKNNLVRVDMYMFNTCKYTGDLEFYTYSQIDDLRNYDNLISLFFSKEKNESHRFNFLEDAHERIHNRLRDRVKHMSDIKDLAVIKIPEGHELSEYIISMELRKESLDIKFKSILAVQAFQNFISKYR